MFLFARSNQPREKEGFSARVFSPSAYKTLHTVLTGGSSADCTTSVIFEHKTNMSTLAVGWKSTHYTFTSTLIRPFAEHIMLSIGNRMNHRCKKKPRTSGTPCDATLPRPVSGQVTHFRHYTPSDDAVK